MEKEVKEPIQEIRYDLLRIKNRLDLIRTRIEKLQEQEIVH